MSRKVKRVRYQLNPQGIKQLTEEEIRIILRGADDLIMTGGRNMLAKILKGSKEKKVLELGLDKSPVYGAFKNDTLQTIKAKVDWMIAADYLDIEYDFRLPMLVYTDKGWEIEKDTYSDELIEQLRAIKNPKNHDFEAHLKDRNRGMILLLLEKIEQTGDSSFIPCLEEWQKVEYKKVRRAIHRVIQSLQKPKGPAE